MGRMIFDLTDEDREALERIRASRGLRSHAEALRAMIREGGNGPVMAQSAPTYPIREVYRSRDEGGAPMSRPLDVPIYNPKPFNPQPKKGKKP